MEIEQAEYKVEIKNPEFMLLLEINERVNDVMAYDLQKQKINSKVIDCLKIDKDSIEGISNQMSSSSTAMALNLIKKIDYIIKLQEKLD